MISEARFQTVEDDINVPVITNGLKKWIKDFRNEHLSLPGKTREQAEARLRKLVKKEESLLLGEIQVGRKRIAIWIQDIPDEGAFYEQPKKASYITLSLNLIIENPARALSILVHELVHGMQQYRKQSERFRTIAAKTSEETEEEMFYYYTEPREIEAQLGQLAHTIVSVFRQKKNKEAVVAALEHVLKLPRERFQDESWMREMKYLSDMFDHQFFFLKTICVPPSDSLRHKQISDRSWRQFKQKLFNLVQSLKEQLEPFQESLNNSMSKFDLVYEKAVRMLREREYIDSTFVDNVRLLVKALKDNDYLNPSTDVESVVKKVMDQSHNVKELVLDTQENALPPMKLQMKQESDSESFSVNVINTQKPDQQKEFKNSMLETIFDDVIEYIKTAALQGIKPEAAVDQLPQAQGANAQPGAEGSALPGAEQEAAPTV